MYDNVIVLSIIPFPSKKKEEDIQDSTKNGRLGFTLIKLEVLQHCIQNNFYDFVMASSDSLGQLFME